MADKDPNLQKEIDELLQMTDVHEALVRRNTTPGAPYQPSRAARRGKKRRKRG